MGVPVEFEFELELELLMIPAVIAAVTTAVMTITPATITQVRRQSGTAICGGEEGAGDGAMLDGATTGWLEDRRAATSVSTEAIAVSRLWLESSTSSP